jgi:hypothetical protein
MADASIASVHATAAATVAARGRRAIAAAVAVAITRAFMPQEWLREPQDGGHVCVRACGGVLLHVWRAVPVVGVRLQLLVEVPASSGIAAVAIDDASFPSACASFTAASISAAGHGPQLPWQGGTHVDAG